MPPAATILLVAGLSIDAALAGTGLPMWALPQDSRGSLPRPTHRTCSHRVLNVNRGACVHGGTGMCLIHLPAMRRSPVRAVPRLEPFKAAIDAMLSANLTAPRKQRRKRASDPLRG